MSSGFEPPYHQTRYSRLLSADVTVIGTVKRMKSS
jgi:hypothetical protein